MQIVDIPIGKVKPGDYAQRFRLDEEKLSELVGSIRRQGLIQPVSVKEVDGEYIVVSGHRRYEACRRAGLEVIPCEVVGGEEAFVRERTFAENFFREDLSPIEQAVSISKEYEAGTMTVEQMAAGFRRSVDWVKRQIGITRWPEDVLEAIHVHGVSVAAASSLALVDDESYRRFLIRNAIENGVTARTTAGWLQAYRASQPSQIVEAVEGGKEAQPLTPAAPQGLCTCCGIMHRVDAMSHIPVCPRCIAVVREVGRNLDRS